MQAREGHALHRCYRGGPVSRQQFGFRFKSIPSGIAPDKVTIMKKLFAVIAPLVLAACAMGPHAQNPDEYIDAFKNSNNMLVNSLKKTEAFQVSEPRKRVLENMKALAQKCIDGEVVVSRFQEGNLATTGETLYSARVENTPAGRSVLSVQVKDLNGSTPGQPANGMYIMAAEFDAPAARQTAINFYYPPGAAYQNIVDAIKTWSHSGPGACPDLR